MMFNQGNMQTPTQQMVQNQAMGNNTYNQPYPPQYYQYTPNWNWNRPVMTNQAPIQNQPINGVLPGKMINNLQEVRPNEVPMDGSASIFPMNDFSSIYVKAWGPDGNIQTLRFIPDVTTNKEVDQGPTEFEKIMKELDAIKVKLGDLSGNQKQQKSSYSSQKKEVNNNAE